MRSRALLWATTTLLALVNANSSLAQSAQPDAKPVSGTFLYVSRESPPEARGSLNEPVVADFGWQGAQFGVSELNAKGKFLGAHFDIHKVVIATGADLVAGVRAGLGSPALIIADLNAADLLRLADAPEVQHSVIVDGRTSDDALRHDQCRPNVFHVLPSWEMRSAALSHFLLDKGWSRWLLLTGVAPEDVAYSNALRKVARIAGAAIVHEAQLPAIGADNPLTQADMDARIGQLTRSAAPYDVILVTDASGVFGERIMFNSAAPRVLAGTQGLTAVAWDPQFRDYAARGFGYRFAQFASRPMSERDYGNWLAVSALGEALTRGQVGRPAEVRDYLRSGRFSVAAMKGEPLTFRASNQELRQPLLLFGPKVLIGMSPPDVLPMAGEQALAPPAGTGGRAGACERPVPATH
jgi:ABC transporter substrate binding protein (PQQ-dependent alcohol dehydrogenase system)